MEIELFNPTQISKADIFSISLDLANKLDEGEISGLLLQSKFKALEKILEKIKGSLTKASLREAAKYSEKQIALHGATFEVAEFGHKYDFEGTGDPVWMRLNAEFLAAKEALKDRETFLKAIKGSETVVDEESGEIVTVTRPVCSSTTAVKCTI